jgi:hypothetical protein
MGNTCVVSRAEYPELHQAQTWGRTPENTIIWSAVHPIDDVVTVNEQRDAVSLNGEPWMDVPGRIRALAITADVLVIQVDADNQVGTRNVFLYDRSGQCLWQVGARDHWPQAPYYGAGTMPNGNIVGYVLDHGFSAEIDRKTGRVLRVFPDK